MIQQNTKNFSLCALARRVQNLHWTENEEGSLVDSSGREKAAVGGGGGDGRCTLSTPDLNQSSYRQDSPQPPAILAGAPI